MEGVDIDIEYGQGDVASHTELDVRNAVTRLVVGTKSSTRRMCCACHDIHSHELSHSTYWHDTQPTADRLGSIEI